MADLIRRRERGQILLIAAFTLAVIFVALALVVNSAIFTENLASRGEVAGSSEALTYQHQVEQSVAAAIEHANHHDGGSPISVERSVEVIGDRGGRQQATGGQLVNVEYDGSDVQWRIADNTSGGSDFQNDSTPVSDPDWQVADSVSGTRNVEINITDTSELSGSAATAFTLEANESLTSIWQVQIWETGGDVVVDVETAGGVSDDCRVPASDPVTIEVTRGLVDGERCHALTWTGASGDKMWWGTGLSGGTYEIWIKNGDQIEGNYSMIVDGAPNGLNLETTTAAGDDPYFTSAVYSTTVDYVFQTTQVTYETEIEVAPGEPP